MARNKELDKVQKDIQAQTAKLKKLKTEEKRLLEAENIRVGKLVREILGDLLPDDTKAQTALFQNLKRTLEQQTGTSAVSTFRESDGLTRVHQPDGMADSSASSTSGVPQAFNGGGYRG